MISKIKNRFFSLILYMLMASFAFIGANCDELLNALGGAGDIAGTWELQRQEGSGQDVCEGEIAEFRENGTAVLQCPGDTPIQRNYTRSGDVLTFTSSGVKYNIETPSGTELRLVEVNVTRTLDYTKIVTGDDTSKEKASGNNNHSSEK